MNTLEFIYTKILSNQVFLSLTSSFIGAIIGGYYTYRATEKSYKNSLMLQEEKVSIREKSTVLSIVEELKILLDSYKDEFDKIYEQLDTNDYVDIKYYVSQNYSTIFSENAEAIGLIKNKELREKIIRTEICLKRYLEYLINHTHACELLEKNRTEFIALVYPQYINCSCSRADNAKEIQNIKNHLKVDNWTWLNSDYVNKMQVINFISSDTRMVSDLHLSSIDLRDRFFELKRLIDELVKLSEIIYEN